MVFCRCVRDHTWVSARSTKIYAPPVRVGADRGGEGRVALESVDAYLLRNQYVGNLKDGTA